MVIETLSIYCTSSFIYSSYGLFGKITWSSKWFLKLIEKILSTNEMIINIIINHYFIDFLVSTIDPVNYLDIFGLYCLEMDYYYSCIYYLLWLDNYESKDSVI